MWSFGVCMQFEIIIKLINISPFVVRIFNIYSRRNVEVYNTLLLIIATMLHIRSPEQIHFIIESLYV